MASGVHSLLFHSRKRYGLLFDSAKEPQNIHQFLVQYFSMMQISSSFSPNFTSSSAGELLMLNYIELTFLVTNVLVNRPSVTEVSSGHIIFFPALHTPLDMDFGPFFRSSNFKFFSKTGLWHGPTSAESSLFRINFLIIFSLGLHCLNKPTASSRYVI